jgi:hypothetical protein
MVSLNFDEVFTNVRESALDSIYEAKMQLLESEIQQLKNKLEAHEIILHSLHTFSSVTMNGEKVRELLKLISNWSYAHRVGNGQYSDEETEELVERAFSEIMRFLRGSL